MDRGITAAALEGRSIDADVVAAIADAREHVKAICRIDDGQKDSVLSEMGDVWKAGDEAKLMVTTEEEMKLGIAVTVRGYSVRFAPGSNQFASGNDSVAEQELVDFESLHSLLCAKSATYRGRFAGSLFTALQALADRGEDDSEDEGEDNQQLGD